MNGPSPLNIEVCHYTNKASPYGHRAGDPQRPGMASEREWLRGAVSRFREAGGTASSPRFVHRLFHS